jgi:hypothetical protein
MQVLAPAKVAKVISSTPRKDEAMTHEGRPSRIATLWLLTALLIAWGTTVLGCKADRSVELLSPPTDTPIAPVLTVEEAYWREAERIDVEPISSETVEMTLALPAPHRRDELGVMGV